MIPRLGVTGESIQPFWDVFGSDGWVDVSGSGNSYSKIRVIDLQLARVSGFSIADIQTQVLLTAGDVLIHPDHMVGIKQDSRIKFERFGVMREYYVNECPTDLLGIGYITLSDFKIAQD